jgi:TPR repeat protein
MLQWQAAALCEAVNSRTGGEDLMIDDWPISPRFYIALVLSIVCLIISACANIEPAVDTSKNNRAEYEATAKALRKSAEEGDASAQFRLGQLYDEGTGVPKDYGQAKEWFEKAAKQGHVGAQINLGTLYLQGEGAPQSDHMALFWFRQAAEQGDALAFAKLGWMSEQGRGVLQDFIQAHKWYNLAAANGHLKAAEYRDALAKQMTPAQIAEAQKLAREWKPKGP